MQQFGIAKENVLCLAVDNASNMTKTIERLNESDPEANPSTTQDETANESEDYGDIEDDWAMRNTASISKSFVLDRKKKEKTANT